LLAERGITLTFYNLISWHATLSQAEINHIREAFSGWLKKELATTPYKTLPFSHIEEALELSVSKATEGKITLVPA
jgi:hypothetical protein